MTSVKNTEKTVPWYKVPIMWFIIMVPLSAVIYGSFMITMAIVTDDGMVVDDYYKHGKEINMVKDRDHAARRLQLSAVVAISTDNNKILLNLRHAAGYQAPEQMQLQLLYATQSGYDMDVDLQLRPDGSYLGSIQPMRDGHWYILLQADDWRLLGSINFPQEQSLILNSQAADS